MVWWRKSSNPFFIDANQIQWNLSILYSLYTRNLSILYSLYTRNLSLLYSLYTRNLSLLMIIKLWSQIYLFLYKYPQ